MSTDDAEIVRPMYEAFHAGDAETALASFDPEVVVDATTRVDGATGRGREDLAAIIVVYEIRGDKITGMTLYGDPDEALEAVGLRE